MVNRLIAVLALSVGALGCSDKGSTNDASKATSVEEKAAKAGAAEATNQEVKKATKAIAGKIEGVDQLINATKDLKGTAKGLAEGGPGLTIEQYEALMLGLSACKVNETGIDRKCEAWLALKEGRKKGRTSLKSFSGQMSVLGKKHIKHSSPAVRMHASSLMGGFFGSSKDNQGVVVAAAKTEKDPAVLYYMIRSVGSAIAKNAEVRALILANTDHANERVRIETGTWLTSTFAAEAPGTLERAMEMIAKDPSSRVKSSICSNLGRRGDERVMPLLAKHTQDPNDPLYVACLRGLIGSWASPVPHKKPSQKGYALTLKRLRETPRSDKRPAWAAISGMRWAKKPELAQRAPWFKKDEVLGVLGAIVKDQQSNWLARTSAVDVMGALGADKAKFTELRKAYADAKGTNAHVLKKIDKQLAGDAK